MSRHAIYRDTDNPERLAWEWTPRPWPGEDGDGPDASPIPPGWTVAAVFDVQDPQPWNVGRLGFVGGVNGPESWGLLSPLGEIEYTPADVLRGEVPPGVTVLWTGPPVEPYRHILDE